MEALLKFFQDLEKKLNDFQNDLIVLQNSQESGKPPSFNTLKPRSRLMNSRSESKEAQKEDPITKHINDRMAEIFGG